MSNRLKITYKSLEDYENIIAGILSPEVGGILFLGTNEVQNELWKMLNKEPRVHIGLRGANWGIVKNFKVVIINDTRIAFATSENSNQAKAFLEGLYDNPVVEPLANTRIIDLMDPELVPLLDSLDGEMMGWDFETRGLPLEYGYKPLGFSLVSMSFGLYIDFRKYTDYLERKEFLILKDFLLKNQKNLVTYYCIFEMKAFLHMYGEWIYPKDAMVIASIDDVHTNLKALSMWKLLTPSWDDELDYEMELLKEYNVTRNPELVEKIKANRLAIEPDADLSLYSSIEDGFGNEWEQCYPLAMARYCIIDSYYSLALYIIMKVGYSDQCIDIFHRNYYHGAYLSANLIPIKEKQLNSLLSLNRILSRNSSLMISRIYGELLVEKYGHIDYTEIFNPTQLKLIELGDYGLLQDKPYKILKELVSRCINEKKLTYLVDVYGAEKTRTILIRVDETGALDKPRATKVWKELVAELDIGGNSEDNIIESFNKKVNQKFIDQITEANAYALSRAEASGIDITQFTRYRVLAESVEEKELNKMSTKGFLKVITKAKDRDAFLDYVTPVNMNYIMTCMNPKYPNSLKIKSLKLFEKCDWDIDKLVGVLSDPSFEDDFLGFNPGNFKKYSEWISFEPYLDMVRYSLNKSKFDVLDNYTHNEVVVEENIPELIQVTSLPDSFKLLDLIEAKFHGFLGWSGYQARECWKDIWLSDYTVLLDRSQWDGPLCFDTRAWIYPLRDSSGLRKVMCNKWMGLNTFVLILGGDLMKHGYFKKSSDKMTLRGTGEGEDELHQYFDLLQYLSLKYGAEKQNSPYLAGNNGFRTKSYKRVKTTDLYTIVDKSEPGDAFEVRFEIASKSTKRWSSFYHTLPARASHDETLVPGITPEMMERGEIISYADINAMEPRSLAYDSNCKNYMSYYENGLDAYIELARLHKPDATPEELKRFRPKFKKLNISITYGMSIRRLAEELNTTVEEAQALVDTYFGAFPEVKEYIERCRTYMKEHDGRIMTFFGDKAQGNVDKYSTQALNYRVQGGASLLATSGYFNATTAAIKLGYKCSPFGIVHDSFQNVIKIKDIVYMEQIYDRYFSGFCYDVKKIKYKYEIDLCTSFRDHVSLQRYDFENKLLTINSGSWNDVKYILDTLGKHYKIRVENFDFDFKYEIPDGFESWVRNGLESHRYSGDPDVIKYPEVNDVKVYFEYDFNDERMNEIRNSDIDTLSW